MRSPPLSTPTFFVCDVPLSAKAATYCRIGTRVSPKTRSSYPSAISSKAVLLSSRPSRICETSPTEAVSPIFTVPESASSSPAKILSSEDLPHPLRPTIPTIAPGSRPKLRSLKRTRSPTLLVRLFTSSTCEPSRGPGGSTMLPCWIAAVRFAISAAEPASSSYRFCRAWPPPLRLPRTNSSSFFRARWRASLLARLVSSRACFWSSHAE
mmetsp:Transcript_97626/g.279212  ORF Transcript_97626/g.279212 Transcript_97626/m.279212 type:complete len:210 (-) Transcript_97626:867-1496(-)